MRYYIVLSFLLVLLVLHVKVAYSQDKTKKDTIYYLVDTLNTPINDRLITVEKDPGLVHQFYTIHCACLDESSLPIFRFNVNYQTVIDTKTFETLKFIELKHLLDFVRKVEF